MSRTVNPLTPSNITALRAALTPPACRLLDAAIEFASELEAALWAVGGPIRDTAVALPLHDIDLAVDGQTDAIAPAIAMRLDAELNLEPRFGTASITLDGDRLDLATLRAERYPAPGALPEVTLGATIEQDLARRDFTVNAIALALTGPRTGELLDPYDGLADLAAGRFAVLHDRSFEDDATRLWRAARLAAQRDLRPTPHTRTLIEDGARWLAPISGTRLWSELELIAQRGRAGRTFTLLDDWGVLRGTHSNFVLSDESRRALRRRPRPLTPATLAATLLAPLPPTDAAAILDRLDAPTAAREAVEGTRTLLASPVPTDGRTGPTDLDRLTETTDEARTTARWLGGPNQLELQRQLRRWERTKPHLDARQLIRLGIEEGPALGEWLRALRRARYLGTLGSPSQARALINNSQRDSRSQP
jgi:tRNA nucleotidyltransferase (CCA-adding enzyme)